MLRMSYNTVCKYVYLLPHQTLPPSRFLTADQSISQERVRRHLRELYWFRPQRPRSRFLHLNCVYRTHEHSEFDCNFPSRLFTCNFMDRALRSQVTPFAQFKGSQPPAAPSPALLPDPLCNQGEHSVLLHCVGNMLKYTLFLLFLLLFLSIR